MYLRISTKAVPQLQWTRNWEELSVSHTASNFPSVWSTKACSTYLAQAFFSAQVITELVRIDSQAILEVGFILKPTFRVIICTKCLNIYVSWGCAVGNSGRLRILVLEQKLPARWGLCLIHKGCDFFFVGLKNYWMTNSQPQFLFTHPRGEVCGLLHFSKWPGQSLYAALVQKPVKALEG